MTAKSWPYCLAVAHRPYKRIENLENDDMTAASAFLSLWRIIEMTTNIIILYAITYIPLSNTNSLTVLLFTLFSIAATILNCTFELTVDYISTSPKRSILFVKELNNILQETQKSKIKFNMIYRYCNYKWTQVPPLPAYVSFCSPTQTNYYNNNYRV